MDNAREAEAVMLKEAENMGKAFQALLDAGVPENQAATLICLDIASREDGGINQPFAPGCMGGGNAAGVTVSAPEGTFRNQSSQRVPVPTPAPEPGS